jgi:multisubunit Na+/H+ antiporter MnhB subunit
MTMALALDIVLATVAIAMAVWTVAARLPLAAVLAFVAYGLLLALVWTRIDAVDVALTEAAIGSGLTGALLIRATARLRTVAAAPRPGTTARVIAAVLSALVAGALATAVWLLPDPAPTLAPAVAANDGATGLGNPVTNVLMVFRAIDTFLEKVVLLLALVGVWSLAPDRFWGGRPALDSRADPEGLLLFLARLLAPVGIVIGIYVLWVSAEEPGGAFQAGTILAAMWLLVIVAKLADAPTVSSRRLRLCLTAGPVLFLAVGLGGLAFGKAFLAYPPEHAKPLILAIEFAMTLTVAATLGLLPLGPPGRKADP